MPFHFFHESGGLSYHLRALRYSKKFWTPFKQSISEWIVNWLSQVETREQIYLIGPSAGHCFPVSLVKDFKKITLVEPDPLAASWMRGRLYFSGFKGEVKWKAAYWPQGVLLDTSSPVLFCNLLGQMPYSSDLVKSFQESIRHRPWLTFHDRYSGKLVPRTPSWISTGWPSSPVLLEEMYAKDSVGELESHIDFQLLPQHVGMYHYWSWNLTPNRWHIIEGICDPHPNKN